MRCKSISCSNTAEPNEDFCASCLSQQTAQMDRTGASEPLSSKYPKYFKDVSDLDEIDVYMVHSLFQIDDPSGCIQHSSKKLLLSGVRTGGKSRFQDIKEARDTLTRWLQINAYLELEAAQA